MIRKYLQHTAGCSSQTETRLPKPARRRRGAAVVEFAVCLPLLMLIVLGAIEATHGIFLKQALSAAAYEGMRVAIEPRSRQADAIQQAQAILDARLVKGSRIAFDTNIDTAPRGQKVAIEVSAPISLNSPFIGRVIQDRVVTVRTVMVRE
ncbi:MAG: TadE family protein [Pirellulaceae bacterium]|nr:TadE family protein [Pirellulaceae bacterium]